MYWDKCTLNFFRSGTREFVKISGFEVLNNKPHWVYISLANFQNLQAGIPLNIALKDYNIDTREFLISGFAPTTNSFFTFKKEPIQTGFVTNAVANSVVFYAMAYLNNKGLLPNEIKALRVRYSFSNLNKHLFSMDELKESFISQSAFFLNLYKEMNDNDRFEHFAENIEQQERFKEVFKHYENFSDLKMHYNRRIFHDKLECQYMRSDFKERTFHKNTGVFSEGQIEVKPNYYTVDRVYLTELKMRLCKKCEKV